mmetsp:Transcript_10603/g.35476  ORF Transcript_10603/g.35476 Transcript_10603/m.35476 type:complete len:101 (+) Transcript_10603:1024-1326(+)
MPSYLESAASQEANVNMSMHFAIQEPSRWESITASYFHSCGLTVNKTIICWGSNDARQNDVPSVVNAQYLSVTSGYHLSCLECGLDRWQICAQLCDERFR